MSEKRYVIVRVKYDVCPIKYMIPKSYKNRCILHNKNCEQCGRTGDTKEQMINKIAQIMFKNAPKETYQPKYIEQKIKILKIAKEIVEFLGVK